MSLSHEKFVFAQADHRRRSGARGHNFVGIGGGENHQRIHAGELPHGLAHGVFQRAAVFHVAFHEVGDDFGVGLGDELVALFFQLALQLDIIFDDAVVHHHDVARAVAMRVRVFLGRAAVRGPARVADAVEPSIGDWRITSSRLCSLPGARRICTLPSRSDHGDARRVVAAILEAAQARPESEGQLF